MCLQGMVILHMPSYDCCLITISTFLFQIFLSYMSPRPYTDFPDGPKCPVDPIFQIGDPVWDHTLHLDVEYLECLLIKYLSFLWHRLMKDTSYFSVHRVALLWCLLACSSIPCISHKLDVMSKCFMDSRSLLWMLRLTVDLAWSLIVQVRLAPHGEPRIH